jgi:hypothetical protein
MRKRTLVASLGAAGALTLTGIGVAIAEPTATPTPSPSTAAPDEDTSTTDEDAGTDIDDRRQAIEQALEGLVEDGTISQEQAGAVAEELDDSPAIGHWWWGHHDHGAWDGLAADFEAGWTAAAQALGMTVDELETALEEGKSLADVAAEKGVDAQRVTDALVNAANTRIDERLADGSLTQQQADELKAEISDWVGAAVDNDWWSRWADHHD